MCFEFPSWPTWDSDCRDLKQNKNWGTCQSWLEGKSYQETLMYVLEPFYLFLSRSAAYAWVYLSVLTALQVHVLHQVLILSGKNRKETSHCDARKIKADVKTSDLLSWRRYFSWPLSQHMRKDGGWKQRKMPLFIYLSFTGTSFVISS